MSAPIVVREPLAKFLADVKQLSAGLDAEQKRAAVVDAGLQLAKIVASIVEGIDADNRDLELPLLKADVDVVARQAADELGARFVVRSAIGWVVGPAIEAAVIWGEPLRRFVGEKVAPALLAIGEVCTGVGSILKDAA